MANNVPCVRVIFIDLTGHTHIEDFVDAEARVDLGSRLLYISSTTSTGVTWACFRKWSWFKMYVKEGMTSVSSRG